METHDLPPVEHRLFGLDRRLFGPTLGVGLLVLLWAVLVPWLAGTISFDDTIEPGTTLDAGSGVTFKPAPGWELSDTGAEGGGVEIHHSGLTFTIRTGAFDGELPDLLDAVNEIEDIEAIAGAQSSVVTDEGVTGISEPFDAPGKHGEIVVFAQEGIGVEVVVVGPKPSASSFGPEIDAMIRSVSFPKDQS